MKAEELMKFDWVNLVEDGKVVASRQVEYIRDVDYYQPIPLTPEILEKNGFELCYDPKGLYSYKRMFQLWFDMARNEITLSIGLYAIVLDYVHELQHALRLCGLIDLANNFKVE